MYPPSSGIPGLHTLRVWAWPSPGVFLGINQASGSKEAPARGSSFYTGGGGVSFLFFLFSFIHSFVIYLFIYIASFRSLKVTGQTGLGEPEGSITGSLGQCPPL